MTGEAKDDVRAATATNAQGPANAPALHFVPARGFMARLGPVGRGLLMLLVLLLIGVLSLAMLFPRSVTPASAPPDQFSGERAMAHLPIIAREPHPARSPAQAHVRDYLVVQLSRIPLEVEVQRTAGVENVVARLRGSDPTGAIVVLAHYDSVKAGPGAGDNGSGVAALLEIMRALAAGPALRNDVIALFDDSEEYGPYAGTRAFVREHSWMPDVRVAISLDTAVAGPISTNETGPNNGWIVQALARAHTGGAWTSISGGGGYDYAPFRDAGVQGLALEDNYPFKEKHTAQDLPEIVSAASVDQMGRQTLAIVRELGNLDIGSPWGTQETWFPVPVLGLVHYPENWSLPLAIAGSLLLVIALGLALRRRLASWRGLGVALGAILTSTVLSSVGIGLLWSRLPDLLRWDTSKWPDWPEVIPPYGWLIFAASGFLVLVLVVIVYIQARRWSAPTDFSLAGLLPFVVFALALAVGIPRAACVPVWIVLIGSLGWIVVGAMARTRRARSTDLAIVLALVPILVLFLPLLPGVFMGDGTKSVAILAGAWVLLLGVALPAVDGLLVHPPTESASIRAPTPAGAQGD
jgi:hypothetical protein